MGSVVREFLEIEKRPVNDMALDELSSEVEGWRAVYSFMPREALEWMARLHEVVRFTKRNYQGSVGILLGFKLEATEYTIGLTESAYDTLHGKRIIEDKILVIPAAMVAYTEFIEDSRDFDPLQNEADLAGVSLETGGGNNGTS